MSQIGQRSSFKNTLKDYQQLQQHLTHESANAKRQLDD